MLRSAKSVVDSLKLLIYQKIMILTKMELQISRNQRNCCEKIQLCNDNLLMKKHQIFYFFFLYFLYYFIQSKSNNRQMHYLSDSSGENDNPDSADLQRLHAAWKNVREKRQSDKKSVGSVKNAIHAEQQKNLQARLAMTEKQLAKARENTALLMKKLSQAEQQLQIKQFEHNKQKKLRQQKQFEIQEIRIQLQRRIKQQTFGYGKQNMDDNRNEIDNYKKKLELKQKQVDRLCLKIKSLELDRQSNNVQIKKLEEINDNLRKQLSDSQYAINQVYLSDHSKGAQLLELNQAHKTIERLILLLRGTEQYKLLGQFAQQARQIHFLSQIPKRLKNNHLNFKVPDKKKMCSCMEIKIDQRLLWTPQNCYRIMLDMKMKYDSLSQDCIQQVLFELNKIWLSREDSHIKRIKQYYESQISKLKKKTQMRYDQLVARKQIQRLKKELTGAKNMKQPKKGVSLQNLKNLGQYQDEIRIKQKEIKLLQERIRLLQTQSNSSDKVLYLEGALWIMEKVLREMNINEQDLRQFESQFRQKVSNNLCTEDWIRSFKQFFETITEINNGLIERLLSMRESTLKKISGDKALNHFVSKTD